MLTNKQKKYLKKEAHSLKPIYQIGKDGVSSNQIAGINDALNTYELIKVKLLDSCPLDKNQVAIELSVGCKCDIIDIIGGTITIFKPSKKDIFNLPK